MGGSPCAIRQNLVGSQPRTLSACHGIPWAHSRAKTTERGISIRYRGIFHEGCFNTRDPVATGIYMEFISREQNQLVVGFRGNSRGDLWFRTTSHSQGRDRGNFRGNSHARPKGCTRHIIATLFPPPIITFPTVGPSREWLSTSLKKETVQQARYITNIFPEGFCC